MPLTQVEYNNVYASAGRHFLAQAGEFADAFSAMLSAAEEEFGPRDPSYTVWSVEFSRKNPSVSRRMWGANLITLILSRGVLELAKQGEFRNAYWELAHESVHLLAPPFNKGANVLEEGVACCFQRKYLRKNFAFEREQKMPCYASAEAKVQALLDLDDNIVWKLRQVEPGFRRITPALILQECPAASEEFAEALTRRFDRDANIQPLDAAVPHPATIVLTPTSFQGARRHGASYYEQD